MSAPDSRGFCQTTEVVPALWTDGLSRSNLAGRLLACIAFTEFGEALEALGDDGLRRRYAEFCSLLRDIRDRGAL